MSNYAWDYLSSFEGYEKLILDSQSSGNLLRFVNDLDDHNVGVFQVPMGNLWNIFYICTKDIYKDYEISINYG